MAQTALTPFRPIDPTVPAWGPGPFLNLYREMNRMFEDIVGGGLPGTSNGARMEGVLIPRMNVSETDRELRVAIELPGSAREDIDVAIDDDVLTVRAEKKIEQKVDQENYHLVERSHGVFQRSLRLPFAVDPDQVQATFENGVLTLVLPKTNVQARSRQIQIKEAQPSASAPAVPPAGAAEEPAGQSSH